jgi:hypothetical protein
VVKADLAQTGNQQHWLIGFSRTGYGGAGLILRNPVAFDKAAVWDFPADWTWSDFGAYDYPHRTETNVENNYELQQTFVSASASAFQACKRLWIGGYYVFQQDTLDFDGRLTAAGILYDSSEQLASSHSWTSGWCHGIGGSA